MAIEDLELKLQQELSRRVVRLLPGNVGDYDGDPKEATDPDVVAIFTGATNTSEYTQTDGTRWKKWGDDWYRDDFVGMPLVELTGAAEITVLGTLATNKKWHRVNRTTDETFELGLAGFGFSAVLEVGTSSFNITTQPGITYDGPELGGEVSSGLVFILALDETNYIGEELFGGGGGVGAIVGPGYDHATGTVIDTSIDPELAGLTVGIYDLYGGSLTYNRDTSCPILEFYATGDGDMYMDADCWGGGLMGNVATWNSTATAGHYLSDAGWLGWILGTTATANRAGDEAYVSNYGGVSLGGYLWTNDGTGGGAFTYLESNYGSVTLGSYIIAEGPFIAEVVSGYGWSTAGNVAWGLVEAVDGDAGIWVEGNGCLGFGYAYDHYITAGDSRYDLGNVAAGFAEWGHIETYGEGLFAFGHADGGPITVDALSNAFQFGGPSINRDARTFGIFEAFRFCDVEPATRVAVRPQWFLGVATPESNWGLNSLNMNFTWGTTDFWINYTGGVDFDTTVEVLAALNADLVTAGVDGELEFVDSSGDNPSYPHSVTLRVKDPLASSGKHLQKWGTETWAYPTYDVSISLPGTYLGVNSMFSRTTEQATPKKGDCWWDNDSLQIRLSERTMAVEEAHDTVEVTASRDLAESDYNQTLYLGGAYTLSLVTALGKGFRCILKAATAAAFTVAQDSGLTISFSGPGTVNDLDPDTVVSDGNQWTTVLLTMRTATECNLIPLYGALV